MLTAPGTSSEQTVVLRRTASSYWCDAAAHLAGGRMVWLGGHRAAGALSALVWIGWRAGHIAEQLDAPLARPVWAWREDAHEHARALEQLAAGKTYALVISHDDVAYVLAVTPDSGEAWS